MIKSIFHREYDAFAFVKPGEYNSTLAKYSEAGMRLVRIVEPKDFHTLPEKDFKGAPEGFHAMIFKRETSIPKEDFDLDGIIFNEGRPYAFLDVETTGLEHSGEDGVPGKDRVIELGMMIYEKDDSNPEAHQYFFNPGFPIPEESTGVHGITDDMVKDAPIFGDKAEEIAALLSDCDIIAYNANFDTTFLRQEFKRAAVACPFDDEKVTIFDPLTIFRKQIPHNLEAAFALYGCGETGQFDAHRAIDDTMAMIAVLKQQLLRMNRGGDFKSLWKIVIHPYLDSGQHFKLDSEGKVVFSFGKYAGERLFGVMCKDMGYIEWMLKQDFDADVKALLNENLKKFIAWKESKNK